MYKDCELWLNNEGQLKKEEQAYGSWIHASPFIKGSSPVIKVPGYYKARKKERKQANSKDQSPISVAVLGSHNYPVVVQPEVEEGADFAEGSNVRGSNPEIEERITSGRVVNSRVTSEEFEERITEIDMELNKFEKGNISGLGFDKDLNLKGGTGADHVTQRVST